MMITKFIDLLNNLLSVCVSFVALKNEKNRKKGRTRFSGVSVVFVVAFIVFIAFGIIIFEQIKSNSEKNSSDSSISTFNNGGNVVATEKGFSIIGDGDIKGNEFYYIENYYAPDNSSGGNTSMDDGINEGNDEEITSDNSGEIEATDTKHTDNEIAETDKKSNLQRNIYSLQQVNEGMMSEAVTFNAIRITDSDSIWYKEATGKEIPDPERTLHNETNFVGACVYSSENKGKDNPWSGTEIVAEDGQTYIVRLYVHNNGDDIAKDTKVRFYVPYGSSDTVKVNGWIRSSNAVPDEYLDNVIFKSKDGANFHLEYIYGSAFLENGGIAKGKGKVLPDSITNQGNSTDTMEKEWITIGYDDFDGRIPGGYEHINYVTIKVKAVYD